MSYERGRFVTEWVSSGGRRRPYLPAGFAGTAVDVTGQDGGEIPPSPNLLIVEAQGDTAELDRLAGDPTCSLLWREEVVRGIATTCPQDNG